MDTNTIIILTAVICFIIVFVIFFIMLIQRGAKNAPKIKPKVIEVIEGRFINHDDLENSAFDLLDEAKQHGKKVNKIVLTPIFE